MSENDTVRYSSAISALWASLLVLLTGSWVSLHCLNKLTHGRRRGDRHPSDDFDRYGISLFSLSFFRYLTMHDKFPSQHIKRFGSVFYPFDVEGHQVRHSSDWSRSRSGYKLVSWDGPDLPQLYNGVPQPCPPGHVGLRWLRRTSVVLRIAAVTLMDSC